MTHTELTIPPEPVETKEQILRNMKSWGTALKKQGLTWQNFLKKMKYRTEDALHWVKGNMSWEDFVKKIIESL